MTVSCIVSAYNESQLIDRCISQLLDTLKKDFEQFELIIIDDGSTDDTADKIKTAAEKDDRIVFLPNYVNLNLGSSVLRGMGVAKYDYITINSVDLCFPIEEYKSIINEAQNYDILVIERVGYKPVLWRRIASNIHIFLLHILFPIGMRGNPVTNYIQVFRKEMLPLIEPLSRSPIFFQAEMIFRAKRKGLRVGNRKVNFNDEVKRKGAFGKPHDIIWGIYDMLRYRLRSWFGNA